MPKLFPPYNSYQGAALSIFLLSNILSLTSLPSISVHKLFQQILIQYRQMESIFPFYWLLIDLKDEIFNGML